MASKPKPKPKTKPKPKAKPKPKSKAKAKAKPKAKATAKPIDRVRSICKAIPGTTEVPAWGTSTWRAGKMFAMYEDHAHGLERVAIWIKATGGNNEIMVATDPKRFFIPPYVGAGGWVGVVLDSKVDWEVVADLLRDGFRLVATRKMLSEAGI